MPILRLVKYILSLAVTLTGAVGYIMFAGRFDMGLLTASAGIFLLAGGSSALNQYQEREFDRMMERTRSRPIPSGKISPASTLSISVILLASGATVLLFTKPVTLILGLLNVLFYNLVYTRLKRSSYLAILPGAIVGALPPIMGWTAAGGNLSDRTIIFMAFLIFLWQIPHFWLLLLKYGKEYEAAGYPSIMRFADEMQVKRMIFVWIALASLFAISFPLYGILISPFLSYLLLSGNVIFVALFYFLLFGKVRRERTAFMVTNIFITIMYLVFAAGALLSRA